jgi:hypothetical protein
MRTVIALLAFVLLAATSCTSSIALQHPDGRRATCGGSFMGGIHTFSAAERDDRCLSDFQRQGFERTAN